MGITLSRMNLSMLAICMVSIQCTIQWGLGRLIMIFIVFPVRNILIIFALFSFVGGAVIFVTSIMLIVALRKVSKIFSIDWIRLDPHF